MNAIAFSLGPITIYWYSLFILCGLLLGSFLAMKEAVRHGISTDFMIDLLFYLVPVAIIGARLYFVLFHFDYYSMYPIEILYIWEGGIAIHGAILGGLLVLLYMSKKHKIPLLLFTDIASISLFIGQAIGRWGNFMNKEAFGPATTYATLKSLYLPKFIIEGMYIDGTYHIPTFFYESLFCLIGLFILLYIRHLKNIKLGTLTSFYLIWYGIIRFFIESLRMDSLMLGPLKMAQCVSIVMIILGIIVWIKNRNNRDYHDVIVSIKTNT